ncbi:MAG: SUMF1/EgtB/PvdO family nonheme iron enzyme [Planctomycetota bacterium]
MVWALQSPPGLLGALNDPISAEEDWLLLCAARYGINSAGWRWCDGRGVKPAAGELPVWWRSGPKCRVGPDGVPWDLLTGLPVHVVRICDGAPMVLIPGGSFLMGCSPEDYQWVRCNAARFNVGMEDAGAGQQHRVILHPYYVDVCLVTQPRYDTVDVANGHGVPWAFSPGHPVTNVNWYDAWAYAKCVGATLPTEAQWERAARGGRNCRFPWGDELPDANRANFHGHIGATTQVGAFAPNPFGLYDMAGNVYEWCLDWYSPTYYAESLMREPPGPKAGDEKVLRGGSWGRWAEDDAGLLHVAFRFAGRPDDSSPCWGFRCVIPLYQATTVDAAPEAGVNDETAP